MTPMLGIMASGISGNLANLGNYLVVAGGGGGGAGAAGATATTASTSTAGAGGVGIASSISGSSVFTLAGRWRWRCIGRRRFWWGGAGSTGGTGTAGTANTGGGAVELWKLPASGAGGSGVVIISYAGSTQLMAGGVVTIAGGNVIHTFTSTGYLAPIEYSTGSLRFRQSNSAYLSRTPTVAGNRKTWTWSGWVKRASFGSSQVLFGAGPDGSNYTIFYFSGTVSEDLEIYNYTGGVTTGYAYTNSVFRDPSAWYHVVLAVDTTQGTSGRQN